MIDGKMIMDTEAEKVIKANMSGDQSLAARVTAVEAKVPNASLPAEAGDYKLSVAVDSATSAVTYSWVAIAS